MMTAYDGSGNCLKDYIYRGNRLIAQDQPQAPKYYYYTPNQINSTRMITDSTGTVVYSAVFDPYGGMQKEWVNTYTPSLKFSGKEREAQSELDYFGARYYDHLNYRFLSVDPVINKDEALANPQLWNLYSFCRNNPVTYLDIDGKESRLRINEHRVDTVEQIPNNPRNKLGVTRGKASLIGNQKQLSDGNWYPRFEFEMTLDIYYAKGGGAKAHEKRHAGDMIGAFDFLSNILFETETNYNDFKFRNKEDCAKFTKSVVESGLKFINKTNYESNYWRDVIPVKEVFHWDSYSRLFYEHD